MIQIRKNTFETNSSSTHAIAIPKTLDPDDFTSFINNNSYWSLEFKAEFFGWDIKKVNHLNYLYTAICLKCIERIQVGVDEANYPIYKYIFNKDYSKATKYIGKILKEYSIKYKFRKPDPDRCWEIWGIDHAECLDDFLNAVFKDKTSLLKYLVNGIVYTGTDNLSDGDIAIYDLDFGPNFDTYHKNN